MKMRYCIGRKPARKSLRFFSIAMWCFSLTPTVNRSEEHTSELQSQPNLVCRLLLEKEKKASFVSRAPGDDDLPAVPSLYRVITGSGFAPRPKVARVQTRFARLPILCRNHAC